MKSPKKSALLVIALMALFLIKGVLLSVLIPFFQNPDEQIHYGTVQYWAELKEQTSGPEEIDWVDTQVSTAATYGLSEEIVKTAQTLQFDEIKFSDENIPYFQAAAEDTVVQNTWKRYLGTSFKSVSSTQSIYYLLSSWLERFYSDQTIFTRMFFGRILALLFGIGILILAYLTAKKIGLSENATLLLTVILAFQPMFSITAAQINIDIALIFSFSLFLYAGVCLLKDGLNWQRILLVISAAVLGLFSKGPGIVLVSMLYPLLAWMTYQKLQIPGKKFLIRLIGTTIILATSIIAIVPQSYWISITNFTKPSAFHTHLESISQYLGKSLQTGELRDTTLSYWGHFGWLDHSIPEWSLAIIIMISIAGFSGTLWYLFSRKKELNFLPERKYLFFLLSMIIALQVAIRFFDWRVFDYSKEILIGQPGRYFLPNITAHLIIIIVGLGFLLRKETRFMLALKVLALAMILLQIHAILNVIIPRYYL